MHRFLRLVCLIAAVSSLLISAQTSRRLAQMAMKEIGPVDHTVPELTHFMVVRVAEGSSQLTLLAGVLAASVAIAGLVAIFSSRLSRDTSGTLLVLVCTIGFIAAFLLLGMTSIAISIGRAPIP